MTLTKELKAVLNVTGLQSKDNRLYQVLESLISNLSKAEDQLALVATTARAATTASSGAITQLTGHVFATGPGNVVSTLSTTGVVAGTYGSSTGIPIVTVNTYGRVTAATTTSFNTGSGITALIGDVFATGPGPVVSTLSTTGVTAGTYGGALTIPILSIDAKGRVTTATTTTFTTGSGSGTSGLISKVTTTGSSTIITFAAVPATCENLKIILMGKYSNTVGEVGVSLKLNSDSTAANYSNAQYVAGLVGVTTAGTISASTLGITAMVLTGTTVSSSNNASFECTIAGVTNTSIFKSFHSQGFDYGRVTQLTGIWNIGGCYFSTNAIATVTLTAASPAVFADNTVAWLYNY